MNAAQAGLLSVELPETVFPSRPESLSENVYVSFLGHLEIHSKLEMFPIICCVC